MIQKNKNHQIQLDLSRAEGNILAGKDLVKSISLNPKEIAILPSKNKYCELIDSIAQFYKISSDCVVLGNGSDELIEHLANNKQGGIAVTLVPSFERLFEVNDKFKYETHRYSLPQSEGYQYTDEFHNQFTEKLFHIRPDLLWLCSPNNPTGTIIDPAYIRDLAKRLPDSWIIIDMVFMDIASHGIGESYISLLNDHDNIILLNSFSKSWGISFLRLGFLLANKKIAQLIAKQNIMFNVNGIALNVAQKCLEKPNYRSREFKKIHRHLDIIRNTIRSLPQYELIINSEINIFCIRHKSKQDLHGILLDLGIKTKSLNKMPGMDNMGYCRILVPRDSKDIHKLLSVLESIA